MMPDKAFKENDAREGVQKPEEKQEITTESEILPRGRAHQPFESAKESNEYNDSETYE